MDGISGQDTDKYDDLKRPCARRYRARGFFVVRKSGPRVSHIRY